MINLGTESTKLGILTRSGSNVSDSAGIAEELETYWVDKLEKLNQDLKNCDSKKGRDALNKQIEETQNSIYKLYTPQNNELTEAAKELIKSKKEEIKGIKNEIEKLKNELKSITKKIGTLDRKIAPLEEQINQLRNREQEIENSLKEHLNQHPSEIYRQIAEIKEEGIRIFIDALNCEEADNLERAHLLTQKNTLVCAHNGRVAFQGHYPASATIQLDHSKEHWETNRRHLHSAPAPQPPQVEGQPSIEEGLQSLLNESSNLLQATEKLELLPQSTKRDQRLNEVLKTGTDLLLSLPLSLDFPLGAELNEEKKKALCNQLEQLESALWKAELKVGFPHPNPKLILLLQKGRLLRHQTLGIPLEEKDRLFLSDLLLNRPELQLGRHSELRQTGLEIQQFLHAPRDSGLPQQELSETLQLSRERLTLLSNPSQLYPSTVKEACSGTALPSLYLELTKAGKLELILLENTENTPLQSLIQEDQEDQGPFKALQVKRPHEEGEEETQTLGQMVTEPLKAGIPSKSEESVRRITVNSKEGSSSIQHPVSHLKDVQSGKSLSSLEERLPHELLAKGQDLLIFIQQKRNEEDASPTLHYESFLRAIQCLNLNSHYLENLAVQELMEHAFFGGQLLQDCILQEPEVFVQWSTVVDHLVENTKRKLTHQQGPNHLHSGLSLLVKLQKEMRAQAAATLTLWENQGVRSMRDPSQLSTRLAQESTVFDKMDGMTSNYEQGVSLSDEDNYSKCNLENKKITHIKSSLERNLPLEEEILQNSILHPSSPFSPTLSKLQVLRDYIQKPPQPRVDRPQFQLNNWPEAHNPDDFISLAKRLKQHYEDLSDADKPEAFEDQDFAILLMTYRLCQREDAHFTPSISTRELLSWIREEVFPTIRLKNPQNINSILDLTLKHSYGEKSLHAVNENRDAIRKTFHDPHHQWEESPKGSLEFVLKVHEMSILSEAGKTKTVEGGRFSLLNPLGTEQSIRTLEKIPKYIRENSLFEKAFGTDSSHQPKFAYPSYSTDGTETWELKDEQLQRSITLIKTPGQLKITQTFKLPGEEQKTTFSLFELEPAENPSGLLADELLNEHGIWKASDGRYFIFREKIGLPKEPLQVHLNKQQIDHLTTPNGEILTAPSPKTSSPFNWVDASTCQVLLNSKNKRMQELRFPGDEWSLRKNAEGEWELREKEELKGTISHQDHLTLSQEIGSGCREFAVPVKTADGSLQVALNCHPIQAPQGKRKLHFDKKAHSSPQLTLISLNSNNATQNSQESLLYLSLFNLAQGQAATSASEAEKHYKKAEERLNEASKKGQLGNNPELFAQVVQAVRGFQFGTDQGVPHPVALRVRIKQEALIENMLNRYQTEGWPEEKYRRTPDQKTQLAQHFRAYQQIIFHQKMEASPETLGATLVEELKKDLPGFESGTNQIFSKFCEDLGIEETFTLPLTASFVTQAQWANQHGIPPLEGIPLDLLSALAFHAKPFYNRELEKVQLKAQGHSFVLEDLLSNFWTYYDQIHEKQLTPDDLPALFLPCQLPKKLKTKEREFYGQIDLSARQVLLNQAKLYQALQQQEMKAALSIKNAFLRDLDSIIEFSFAEKEKKITDYRKEVALLASPNFTQLDVVLENGKKILEGLTSDAQQKLDEAKTELANRRKSSKESVQQFRNSLREPEGDAVGKALSELSQLNGKVHEGQVTNLIEKLEEAGASDSLKDKVIQTLATIRQKNSTKQKKLTHSKDNLLSDSEKTRNLLETTLPDLAINGRRELKPVREKLTSHVFSLHRKLISLERKKNQTIAKINDLDDKYQSKLNRLQQKLSNLENSTAIPAESETFEPERVKIPNFVGSVPKLIKSEPSIVVRSSPASPEETLESSSF